MSTPWRANKELNDRIYRIKMRGLVMRLRAEQRELEEREFRSWLMWERYKIKQRGRELEERYNHNHDPKTGQFTSGKGLTGGVERGTMKTSGAVSGALDRYSPEAQEHADRYYEEVRHMKTDAAKIAANTGISVEEIQQIKEFVFIEEHDLGGKHKERFYPNYEMAQSWQRLIEGKNIQPHDLTLLRHELMERSLMEQGMEQSKAHDAAQEIYDYSSEVKKYYAEIDKHKKA